ncbi:MAG TPA: glycosyltransferase family 4 protein [Thermoanaerobaculia bacterium]
MHLLIVLTTLNAGGMERAAVNMANHWAARGWRPTILTTSQRGRPIAYALDPRVIHRDLGWRRHPEDHEMDHDSLHAILGAVPSDVPEYDLVLADIVLLTLLRRAVQTIQPEVILSLGDVMNVRMLIATHGLRVRRLVSERCDPERTQLSAAWERLRRRIYPRADLVVAQTRTAARWFEQHGAKARAIANPVVPAPAKNGHVKEARSIVAVARLVAFKRLNVLIRAFAAIEANHPEWRLDIWGEGPLRDWLRELIEKVGAQRITLRGHASDVYAAFREADLFAMTSVTEGFPNALCEAMAAGLPAVVYDCGAGVREIVRDGVDGVLVREDGPEAFAVELEKLMRDDDRRERLAARAPEIVERFSVGEVMRQWEECIG